MTDRTWLLYPLTKRTTRKELLDLLDQVPGYSYQSYKMPKQELKEDLLYERQKYWKQNAFNKAYRKVRHKEALTAEECNTFLATLPDPIFPGSVVATLETDMPIKLTENSASFSACKKYRYNLTRKWAKGASLVFVMLNPSTADADSDDPTIRKCMGYAQREGYGGLVVVNLFAYRTTDPKGLLGARDPWGPSNDRVLEDAIAYAGATTGQVVVAWGGSEFAYTDGPVEKVYEWARGYEVRLMCLGLNADESPSHPLYLKKQSKLIPIHNL